MTKDETKTILKRLRAKVAKERAFARGLLRAYEKAGTLSSSTAERAYGEANVTHQIVKYIDKEIKALG